MSSINGDKEIHSYKLFKLIVDSNWSLQKKGGFKKETKHFSAQVLSHLVGKGG